MFLTDLLILLVFVWLGRKLFQCFKLPSLFGEVFAGIVAGPIVLGLVSQTEAITVLAELGIFFMMFHAGLEFDPKDILKSSKKASWVALGNIVFSLGAGALAAYLFDLGFQTGILLGMILSVTAVAISTRLFKDHKLMKTRVAHTVISAAVITEVIILILFSIFLDVSQSGVFELQDFALDLLKFIAYFAVVFYVGHKYFKQLYRIIYKGNKGFTFSIILALALGVSAEWIGLHFIIGAFLAGLFLHSEMFDDEVFKKIEDRSFGISYSFLAPVFFASLAFHLNFEVIKEDPFLFIGVLALALVTKFLGTALGAHISGMKRLESFGIGLSMNSRGAVDLIIATIALESGLISPGLFSVIVLVAFITTLISTTGLKSMKLKLQSPK